MKHEKAASLRSLLNAQDYVEGPDAGDDRGRCTFKLVRVAQPGYLNGEPMYEVLLRVSDPDSFALPSDFLEIVADRDCYLRVDGDEVHIRDWTAEGTHHEA